MDRVKPAEALTKQEFHKRLRRWLDNTDDPVIKPDVLSRQRVGFTSVMAVMFCFYTLIRLAMQSPVTCSCCEVRR